MKSISLKLRSSALPILLLTIASPMLAQIDEAALDSIYERLVGEDYAARYEARMELQDYVSAASAPDNEEQESHVAEQLIERLESTQELTAKLWTLRQLSHISSTATVPAFTALLDSDNEELVDAARMALESTPSHQADAALVEDLIRGVDEEFRRGILDTLSRRMSLATASGSVDADGTYIEGLTRSLNSEAKAELQKLIDEGQYNDSPFMQLAAPLVSDDPEFLEELALNGMNRSIRNAAFSTLVSKRPKSALSILENAIDNGEEPSSLDFIRIAMDSDRKAFSKTVIKSLDSMTVAQKTVALGALPAKRSTALESQLLQYLDTENETLKIQTIAALGKVGSVKSLDPMLELIDGKNRDYREAAEEALAILNDPRVDRELLKSAKKGEAIQRIAAVQALGFRASPGASELLNKIASDDALDLELRREAISAMELVGEVESLPVLVQIIVNTENARLRRDAQRTIKRLTLRLADPEAAWAAFESGFEQVNGDSEKEADLLIVIDSAPSEEALEFLQREWDQGDESTRKAILRVLPSWRNWQGGFALLDIAGRVGDDTELRAKCFDGIGKLILGSNATFSIAGKFELSEAALEKAQSPEERQSVISGFRYSTWRERVHVTYNEVDPELKEAVLEYAAN